MEERFGGRLWKRDYVGGCMEEQLGRRLICVMPSDWLRAKQLANQIQVN